MFFFPSSISLFTLCTMANSPITWQFDDQFIKNDVVYYIGARASKGPYYVEQGEMLLIRFHMRRMSD